jgi:hypothetical protein
MFKAKTLFFTPKSLVADCKEPADKLMIVCNGTLDLFVYSCCRDPASTDVSEHGLAEGRFLRVRSGGLAI